MLLAHRCGLPDLSMPTKAMSQETRDLIGDLPFENTPVRLANTRVGCPHP